MNVSFFSDLLATISERGRGLMGLGRDADEAGVEGILKSCRDLLSRRGEASGVALARAILDRYETLPRPERYAFLTAVAEEFAVDEAALARALDAYRSAPSRTAAGALHAAAEPRSQELIRRLNLADGGTVSLVHMREDLLDLARGLRADPAAPATLEALDGLDGDFVHLFSSWFNRGFLVLRRIDWTTPANILEKIIRYEAVHEISDWDDLRRRIAPVDRRCFAFFHPALVDEPLIFVEVALTGGVPDAIEPILSKSREPIPLASATTATFYSISNCQRGLAGVSFGNFLIKQVVEDLCRELPRLRTFATLSPVPGFAAWLAQERAADAGAIAGEERDTLRLLDEPDWHLDAEKAEAVRAVLVPAAAAYFLRAKGANGRPLDPVARFHLGNGARLERLNFLGDVSAKGLKQSHGLMVNYLYDLDTIERHHEAYADLGTVTASPAVQRALRDFALPA